MAHHAIRFTVITSLSLNAALARAALVLDVDALLERLPAQVGESLGWTKAPIAAQLGRLQRGVVSDALLDEVARAIAAPLEALGRTFRELMATNQDVLRAAVMDDIERDQRRVQAYVDDADAIDTADWAFGLLRSFFNATLAVFGLAVPSELQSTLQQGLEDWRLADLLRGQIAVMGAIEAVKSQAPREKVVELIEVAFLRLMRARDHLRKVGLWAAPYPEETTGQRRQDTPRYAQRVREVFTDEDWVNFGQARFGDLR
ncbi:MAG TPA: hypothetical protein VJN18_25030 [Polyangiaceae bacterium]|nr:hypothetical protein [Polyangiaceae bacterium]